MSKSKKTKTICRRSSCLALIEVNQANPNGDPDGDARPRTLNDRRGWMTPVSIKRKVRNLFEDHDSPVFADIAASLDFDPKRFFVFESLSRGSEHDDPVEASKWALGLPYDEFIQRFYDVRIFGATALEGTKDDKGKKKEGDQLRLKKTGPITLSPAVSIAPVDISEATISKMATLRTKVLAKDASDLAPSAFKMVNHGLYVAKIVVNPHVARATETTEEDIRVFKSVLKSIFDISTSASRPGGTISFRHLWWADHSNALGSFNEQDFFEKMMPKKRGLLDEASTSINDYEIPTPKFDFDVEDLASDPLKIWRAV